MKNKDIMRAVKITGSGVGRFVYDAHFYAEKMVSVKKLLDIVHELEYGRDVGGVVEDYALDILAKRTKPLTTETIKRRKIKVE